MAWWIFQNVAVTAIVAGLVALACRTTRIGPVARHALWVLVLVKFLTPPLVSWPWAAPDPFGVSALDDRADARIGVTTMADPLVTSAGPDLATAAPSAAVEIGRAGPPAARWPATWRWLLWIWVAGSLTLLSLEAARLARLARRVRAGRPPDHALVARVTALSSTLGLPSIPVLIVSGITSPMVWCWGRPRLLWPAELTASDACIDGLLVHEMAHIKRRDHIVGWLELAGGVVWWWNPLFWFVRSSLREQAELACDAWVISALPNGRRAYAESLLALSSGTSWTAPSLAMVGMRATSRRLLERRLVMIMKGRAPLHLPAAGVVCLVLAGVATLPAWAASQQVPPPPPPARVDDVVVQTNTPKPQPPPVRDARRFVLEEKQGPPSPPKVVAVTPRERKLVTVRIVENLPADGRDLLERFETDRTAIQREADERLDARRGELIKALEALQEQYTKAGRLDEAVAIRDYLRAGPPGTGTVYILKNISK